jgi:transcription-repair coupling factor (superfamily II helicase)
MTLSASLAAHGLRAPDELSEDFEPMPDLVPPEGVVIAGIAEAALETTGASKPVWFAGTSGSALALYASEVARKRPVVLVTRDNEDAQRLASDVAFYAASEEGVFAYAAPESSPYAEISPDRRSAMQRLAVLAKLSAGFRVLVVPASALARKVLPKKVLADFTPTITAEDELDRSALIEALSATGYLRVPLVEDPGTFSVRGALLDIWPPGSDEPVRIELYGDLVVTIRAFDPAEQKTLGEPITKIACAPVREAIVSQANAQRARQRVTHLCEAIDFPTSKMRVLIDDVLSARAFFGADGFVPSYYDALGTLFDYVPKDAIWILDEAEVIQSILSEDLEKADRDVAVREGAPVFPPSAFYLPQAEVMRELSARPLAFTSRTAVIGGELTGVTALREGLMPRDLWGFGQEDLVSATKRVRSKAGKASSLGPLVRRLAYFADNGLRVVLTTRAMIQAERLLGLLRHQGVDAAITKHVRISPELAPPNLHIVVASLSTGLLLPAASLAIVTEEEIFGTRARKAAKRSKESVTKPFLEDLRALKTGDYVVHVEHGIGKYHGLIHRTLGAPGAGGVTVDLLVVEYAGGDKLYLPAYRLNQIQKFSGGEQAEPKIDRLGGQTFAKTKSRVKKAVREMADELLRLYAERESAVAEPLPEVSDEYRTFEATFPFEETPDQAKAIDEVNSDFVRARPMDRLVCGDVGFGKTEVAIRAAFRIAMSGKQVCVLCPTTVLAQQHFRVFQSRIADYPVRVRSISRFETKKEQEVVLSELKDGTCDIVIGTHRLLSKDIHFKNLGLMVVDEEQRFGVTHKERIKQMKAQVHVLTLSATPIPRTLQMAVSGLRDLSLITTAPTDRRAVRTIVTRYDDKVIREALERELSRGGQVFYVYNRVEGIYERAQRLQELLPNARIVVGHGQMAKAGPTGESALEKVMVDFVEGKYDILVATTIIESGLDIPRANTILIDRADMYGLSQLYQLRGRVGRSKERAYCYLIVPPIDSLTEEARARIEALERHTELGSGFKIASLDLELRGAGDLLGGEQSGNVASVGFDLFCQMLADTVNELRGEVVVHEVDPEISFDIEAILPEDYITDVGIRLSLYKRLASAIDEAQVEEIGVELEDRFGPPPQSARNLIVLMSLKTELRRLRVLGCEASKTRVTLHLREDTPLDPRKITELVRAKGSPYKLTPDMKLTRRFDDSSGSASSLANTETLLSDLQKCMKAEA